MLELLRKQPKLAVSIVLEIKPKIAEREAGKNVEVGF
jgi:hypothetical protein